MSFLKRSEPGTVSDAGLQGDKLLEQSSPYENNFLYTSVIDQEDTAREGNWFLFSAWGGDNQNLPSSPSHLPEVFSQHMYIPSML